MTNVEIFKQELKNLDDWYPQATNMVPIFINSPARSGFNMKRELGFGYSKFIFRFQSGWGEMFYSHTDLDRLWREVKAKLETDPDYLIKVRDSYSAKFETHRQTLETITNEFIKGLSDDDLLKYLQLTDSILTDACGIGHVVEPISLRIEEDFKNKLSNILKSEAEFKKYFPILTAPTSLSFIASEENALYQLAHGDYNESDLSDHLKEYFWIQNNYSGPDPITLDLLRERIKDGLKQTDINSIIKAKNEAIKELSLTQDILKLIEIIDFTTVWQDDRKANIVRTISYVDAILQEISRRIDLSKKDLYYLSCFKLNDIKSLAEIKTMQKIFSDRRHGVFFLVNDEEQEISVVGDEYREVESYLAKIRGDEIDEELHGSISNPGTAIGPAAICTTLESITKVKDGDILIASITRPEYMPAIRKAAAIVTDEGGITCHAAIVSREMNIPCIVGTKKATKMFKDGEMLEVRANHGVVRKIKI